MGGIVLCIYNMGLVCQSEYYLFPERWTSIWVRSLGSTGPISRSPANPCYWQRALVLRNRRLGVSILHTHSSPVEQKVCYSTSWCPRVLFDSFAQNPLPAAEQLSFEIAGVFVCELKHRPCQNVWFMSTIRRNLKGSIQISNIFCLKMRCFLLESLSLITGREFLELYKLNPLATLALGWSCNYS